MKRRGIIINTWMEVATGKDCEKGLFAVYVLRR